MSSNLNRVATAIGVAAAMAIPAVALAHDGGSGAPHGDGQSVTGASGVQGRHGGGGRTEKFEVRGSAVSVDTTAQTVVVSVKRANHGRRGRALAGLTLTFDVSAARIQVRDVNGDGARDLADVQPGDPVEVRAELPRSSAPDLSAPIAAQRFRDRARPAHPGAGSGTEPNDTAPHS
jgi:hypothetical protein